MKLILVSLAVSLIFLSLTGCSLSLLRSPTPFPTLTSLSSPTPLAENQTAAATALPATTSQPTAALGTPLRTGGYVPTPTVSGIAPGSPSGPYGVILVSTGAVLNVRSAPGINSPVIGSLTATTNNVMRTGPSSSVNGVSWVEVQNPSGVNGWVNSAFLTEYIPPASFCADNRVNNLLTSFGSALKASNGATLASLVSPAHGITARLWRNGNAIVFDQAHAHWIFISTYEHDWGAAPASGLDTVGAFHTVLLPKLLDVFNAPAPGFALICDAIQTGGASYNTSWPALYTNVNFYSIYKPGPAGNENSWRTLLVGVEYVQDRPYVFSITQLEWEP